MKFQDGTYLEFINLIDSLHAIGKYYTNFLKTRQGATSLAISITNSDLVMKMLNEKKIPFAYDSNKIWQTIEPDKADLFFIEYADKHWKETIINTTHLNTANSLNAIYSLTDKIEEEAKKYKRLGFTETENGKYIETRYKLFKIGQSNLYLLDDKKSSKINQLLNSPSLGGICGFQIKVNSLPTFNKYIKHTKNVVYEKNRTTIYFKDYTFFLTFTE